jgi:hypothetical protein
MEKMESSGTPRLAFLHSDEAMSQAKLATFRRVPTDAIRFSLLPGQPGSLKVRPNGIVLDGHHRLLVLLERGEDIHQLPREIMEPESNEA